MGSLEYVPDADREGGWGCGWCHGVSGGGKAGLRFRAAVRGGHGTRPSFKSTKPEPVTLSMVVQALGRSTQSGLGFSTRSMGAEAAWAQVFKRFEAVRARSRSGNASKRFRVCARFAGY